MLLQDDIVNADTPNGAGDEEANPSTDPENNDSPPDDSADEPDEVEKLKQLNRKLFERAKTAEGFVLQDGNWVKKPKPVVANPPAPEAVKPDTMTAVDIIALAKAQVNDEDYQEVVDYAKYKNISISDALKSNYIKTTLQEREEQRKSASATIVDGGKRASTTRSGEQILSDFETKGIAPKTDDEWEKLHRARMGLKK
jgi:hypothetical protein